MITMWNGSIALPRVKETGQDKEGFDTHENITWEGGIPANFTDATRNDEILAFQKGYSADRNIETMACNYRGEGTLKDESDGSLYEVKRTYKKEKMATIVLTCQRRECSGV
nr:MAG TPA: hypothetical protein [Caudoviricetes sp.]